ncbi:MAG: glutathione S-transferase family protein [Thermoplasmata archaeon]|nr:glutathione S-transferase family protein [Thermoplasmata archaeon]
MSENLRLYYAPWSHYCVSVERMLAFKRVVPEIVPIPYHDRRELLRATGQDYLPAITWGDRTVAWQGIPDFLEERSPLPTLYPAGKGGLAKMMENWGHQVLEERVWRYVLPRIGAAFTDDHERWVFEELQTRSRGPLHVLEGRRGEFRSELLQYLGLLEEGLRGRAWLLDEPSLADFGVFGALAPLRLVGEEIPSDFPSLAAWSTRIEQLHA